MFFAPASNMRQKILYKTKLSQYTQLYTHTLHRSSYTSTYDNNSAPDWVDSKIVSIKLSHFPPWLNQKQADSNINSKFLWPRTRLTCYLSINLVYHFYSLLMILNILLNIFFYDKSYQRFPTTVRYCFTWLRKFPIKYFHVICKYYQSSKYGRVLGYPIQDPQCDIPLRKTLNNILCVNSFLIFLPTPNFKLKIRNHHCAPNIYQNQSQVLQPR